MNCWGVRRANARRANVGGHTQAGDEWDCGVGNLKVEDPEMEDSELIKSEIGLD